MAAPPPVLTVAVEKGPRRGETRQCRAGAALRVGRVVKGNDLAVRDGGASQHHLVIEFLPPPGAGWAVSDLGTSNGTLLNGAALVPSVPAPLSHGDVIKVGDSTVLAVSIAPDSDPNPVANPTSRHAAAAVEEKPAAVTRRGRRNIKAATAAEAPEVEKEEPDAAAVEEPDAAAVVMVAEKPPAVTRRGTRSKAPPVAEPPEVEKEEPDAAAVVVEEKPQVARRRGGRKKMAPGQMDETAEASRQCEQKEAPKPSEPEKDDEEKEEVMVPMRRGSRRSVTEPSKPMEEEKEENAPAVTRRGGRKRNVATVAPLPLPPKPKSVRGWGTRATASTTVLQEEQGGDELAASRAETVNLLSPTAVKGGEEQKGFKVAAGDGGVELQDTAKALKDEEIPKGRDNAHHAASDNDANAAAAEPTGEMEEAAEVNCHRRRMKVVEHYEPEKDGEETTVVTRRGGRKVVMEQSEPGKDDDTTLVTRRGHGRQKKLAEQPEPTKDVEQTTVATRRGGRKKAADQLEPEKGMEETTILTRRGGQKKVAEQPELVKEDTEKEEGAPVLARRGGRKKNALLVAPPLPELVKENDEKEESAPALTRRGGRKKNALLVAPPSLPLNTSSTRGRGRVTRASMTVKALEEELPEGRARAKLSASNTVAHAAAVQLTVEMEETSEAPRRGRQKKAIDPPEPEKEDEEKEDAIRVTRRRGQKKDAVVACHAGRKKDSTVIAPPPLPPKTASGRGRRRVTRTSARNNVLDKDAKGEQEEDEVNVPIEQAGNLQIAMAVNYGEDREVKGAARASEDDSPEGRDSVKHASSENRGQEDQGGVHCSSRVHSGSSGIPNTTSKYREDRKLKAYSTPFDVRVDRALKKYST
ncbi:ABC transporter F family member 4-like [Lolium rigidum]|uniref:ABC transporter F family member 4-like n=1 Tax=Lolium rigidum TaxID=89674 RepID=UPI001F5CB812|nr:ABC transporter F family member 4-like [Lolium rigidum]